MLWGWILFTMYNAGYFNSSTLTPSHFIIMCARSFAASDQSSHTIMLATYA